MLYRLEAACGCDPGKLRSGNEDNLYFDGLILPQENDGMRQVDAISVRRIRASATFGVFDGMGGEADGQVASFLAASAFKTDCERQDESGTPPQEFLTETIRHMNRDVCRQAESRFCQMGTTAVMLHFRGGSAYVCNVGDSRAFRLQRNVFLQISQDHTDAKVLQAQGITNRKPRLTQCIGTPEEEMVLQPHIAKGTVLPGSQFLLCSDGLTDMVQSADICGIMKESRTARICVRRLIDAALDNGGSDNVTAIVIRVHNI